MYVSEWVYTTRGSCPGQRSMDPLELQLPASVSHLTQSWGWKAGPLWQQHNGWPHLSIPHLEFLVLLLAPSERAFLLSSFEKQSCSGFEVRFRQIFLEALSGVLPSSASPPLPAVWVQRTWRPHYCHPSHKDLSGFLYGSQGNSLLLSSFCRGDALHEPLQSWLLCLQTWGGTDSPSTSIPLNKPHLDFFYLPLLKKKKTLK